MTYGALAWRHAAEINDALRAAIPGQPDLSNWPAELRAQLASCEARVRSGSGRIAALGELSQVYHANGFLDEAGRGYRVLLRADPRNPRWPHLLAHIVSGYGESVEAQSLFHRAVSLAPDYLPARLRLADVLLKTGAAAAAGEQYAVVLQREPQNPYALLGLARCDIAADRWTDARARLQAAAGANPDFQSAWNVLAAVHDHLGDATAAAAARKTAERATRFREPADPWLNELTFACYDVARLCVAATVSRDAGDARTTRSLLERAVNLAPDDAASHALLGTFLTEIRDFAKAGEHLERAVALAPLIPENWLALVTLRKSTGDGTALDRALAAGLAQCPDSYALHLEHGRRLKALGRPDEAQAEFARCRRLKPDDTAPYIESAMVHFRGNEFAQGAAELRAALSAVPNDPGALVFLTRYSIESRNEAEAASLLARARQHDRVRTEDLASLLAAYQAAFGRMP